MGSTDAETSFERECRRVKGWLEHKCTSSGCCAGMKRRVILAQGTVEGYTQNHVHKALIDVIPLYNTDSVAAAQARLCVTSTITQSNKRPKTIYFLHDTNKSLLHFVSVSISIQQSSTFTSRASKLSLATQQRSCLRSVCTVCLNLKLEVADLLAGIA